MSEITATEDEAQGFRNYYECPRCGCEWADEWPAICDDDCPSCGFRHVSPSDSEDI